MITNEKSYAIRRLDGEPVYDEFTWMDVDGPNDYTVVDASGYEGDYEIVLMSPVRVSARRYRSELCDTCHGEGETGSGEDCPACNGTGEQEPWVDIAGGAS